MLRRPIGRVLADGRFISEHQLAEAVALQKENSALLGQILVGMGVVNQDELEAVLTIQEPLARPDDAVALAAGVRQQLGQLLVRAGKISPQDLDDALEEQSVTGRKLGEILVDGGLVTEDELSAALRFQSGQQAGSLSPIRLGEVLVRAGVVTRGQLDVALTRQRGSGRKLGEILVLEGHITEAQLSFGLKLQEKLVTAALVAALALASVGSGLAAREASAAEMGVSISASVRGAARIRALTASRALVITNQDIERGYVIVRGVEYEVRSNSGYRLQMSSACAAVSEIRASGPFGEETVFNDGSMVTMPFAGTAPRLLSIDFRLLLAGDAQPGTYTFPVQVSIHPS